MNPLKTKLASIIIDLAHEEIRKLDRGSPYLKALKGINIDEVLTEDVSRLCEDISTVEIMRLMPLIARMKIARPGTELKVLKGEIREITLKVVKRVEHKGGRLKLPASCRDLLLEL
jgi:hypothetical protein